MTSGTKNAFKKAGVKVESLEELAKGKVDGIKRSNHVLLEKKLPYGATKNERGDVNKKIDPIEKDTCSALPSSGPLLEARIYSSTPHETLHAKFNLWLIVPLPKPPDIGKFS